MVVGSSPVAVSKIVMLARSKLKTIESKIPEALINSELSHEDFITIIKEEKQYRELKESIRMMNNEVILKKLI